MASSVGVGDCGMRSQPQSVGSAQSVDSAHYTQPRRMCLITNCEESGRKSQYTTVPSCSLNAAKQTATFGGGTITRRCIPFSSHYPSR